MNWLSTRRRHPAAALVVLMLALLAFGTVYSVVVGSGRADAAGASAQSEAEAGQTLFLQNCSSCHGLGGQGSSNGPTLIGVGAASVHFQVITGRMPLAAPAAQAPVKQPEFNATQTAQLAAYVATLGPGPAIPSDEEVSTTDADLVEGGELFRTNCSQCHSFSGSGGALTQGKYAPSLQDASPTVIYEAMLTGPQNMPVFSNGQITPAEKQDVIAYIQNLQTEKTAGGAGLGKIGPVAEGAVIWVVVIGGLVLISVWIAGRLHRD